MVLEAGRLESTDAMLEDVLLESGKRQSELVVFMGRTRFNLRKASSTYWVREPNLVMLSLLGWVVRCCCCLWWAETV